MSSSLTKIIEGCILNKRSSQEELYRLFFPKMIAMCFRYTSDEDKALMMVNDGFLKVFQKISTFQNRGSFEGWVRRLVFTSISDHFRKENKYIKLILFEEAEKREDDLVLDRLYYDDLLKLVESLPGNTHKVFQLYAIEGYNHREISELLNISEGTSKWHLSEARKKLKQLVITNNQTFKHA
jgi:RNA polymerase sigma-70 factor (ECF subfamily)